MTQSDEIEADAETTPPKRFGRRIYLIVIAAVLLAAAYILATHFSSDATTIPEILAGTAVLRVPAPGGARPVPFSATVGDANAQATFTNIAENKDEIRYGIACVNDEALTAGRYLELITGVRRELSGMSPLLKAEFVKQAIFQRTGIMLKRADIEQYEENNVLVRKVKGDTINDYGVTVHINSTQLIFLFQNRAYLLTVLSSATLNFTKDTLKEAWKWHGEILAVNSDER